MARIVIEINTDNEAFEYDFNHEVARILEGIGERISNRPDLVLNLHDRNGIHVGTARIEESNHG